MTANPNATMAAAAVFNRRDPHQQSLSSAAAAAALRARPATPTNVSEVQTKRTMRRSASMSSSGTAPDASGRPTSASSLQRRGSSGSMAEKTFRAPSPHRPATAGSMQGGSSSGYGQPRQQEVAPPVPALPENMNPRGGDAAATNGPARQQQRQPQQQQQQHRKANSLGIGPAPFRVASQKLGKEGTPSWFGASQVGDMKNMRTSDAAITTNNDYAKPATPQLPDEGRPSSRASSINFSYPGRARVASPPASPVERSASEFPFSDSDAQNKRTSSRSSSMRKRPVSVGSTPTMVYDPNSRRMVPRYETVQEDSGSRITSEKPNKKHRDSARKGKSSHAAQVAAGRAQAASAELGPNARTQPPPTAPPSNQQATASGPTREPDYYQEEPSTKAIISSPRLDAKRIEQQRAQEMHAESNVPEADGTAISIPSDAARVSQPIRRQPSVVKEESEPEDDESRFTGQDSLPSVRAAAPTRQMLHAGTQPPAPSSTEDPSRGSSLRQQQPVELAGEAVPPQEAATMRQEKSVLFEPRPTSEIRNSNNRAHSYSPVRTAHFGTIQDSPDIRHSPPPRSVSPRKPALKQRSPSRDLSPDGNTSEASGNANAGEELAVPRKKAVRVSFNDANNVLVGEPAPSPQAEPTTTQSNATRRPWYSNIARGKKKDLVSLDDDEVMKPRPALPSFGSVRDKKFREVSSGDEERPLVRPYELRPETSPTGASTDAALGGLLLQQQQQQEADLVSRNAANISRFREPLPPVVTSVDGGGYMSDSSSDSDQAVNIPSAAEESSALAVAPSLPTVEEVPVNGSALTAEPVNDNKPTTSVASSEGGESDIPAIMVSQPTPPPPKTAQQPQGFFEVPGGFPDEESETSAPEAGKTAAGVSSKEPARQIVLEPVVQEGDIKPTLQDSHTPATVLATAGIPEDEDTDTSDSGIYSDAYEDLSDIDEGGFMSLDAVVESPITRDSANRPTGQNESRLPPGPVEEPQTPPNPQSRPSETLSPSTLVPDLSSASTAVESRAVEGGPDEDWERAKAFWRSLTAEKRAQLEREAREDAGVEGDLDGSPKPAPKMKKKKSADRRISERKALAVHMAQQMMAKQQDQRQKVGSVGADRTYMIQPGTRVEDEGATQVPHDVPTMRKTMRGKGGSILKTSGAATTERSAPPSSGPQGHSRHASEGTKSSFIPNPLRRRGSGSSESSFRRSPLGQGAGFGFRKTMRQSSPAGNEPAARTPPSKRFSLRSLSPTGGFGRPSPPAGGGSGLRQTLRGPPAQERPSTASRIASFGRGSSSGKGGRGSRLGGIGSKGSSRFGDSSDDEDAPRTRFRSRFDDSSDEDDIAPRPQSSSRPLSMPLTSRPRVNQASAEASPALPEEEEEDDEDELAGMVDPEKNLPQSAVPSGVPNNDNGLRRSRSGRGGLVGSQTTPITSTAGVIGVGGGSRSKKRNSLMSVLRRKKQGSGAIQRSEMMDSAARRDTRLERAAHQLKGIRSHDRDHDEPEPEPEQEQIEEPQARSPRLQKRTVSLTHDVGASWPFPGREGEVRSGNLGTRMLSGSPAAVMREPTTMSLTSSIGEGKKKRFGALRRVFRLPE